MTRSALRPLTTGLALAALLSCAADEQSDDQRRYARPGGVRFDVLAGLEDYRLPGAPFNPWSGLGWILLHVPEEGGPVTTEFVASLSSDAREGGRQTSVFEQHFFDARWLRIGFVLRPEANGARYVDTDDVAYVRVWVSDAGPLFHARADDFGFLADLANGAVYAELDATLEPADGAPAGVTARPLRVELASVAFPPACAFHHPPPADPDGWQTDPTSWREASPDPPTDVDPCTPLIRQIHTTPDDPVGVRRPWCISDGPGCSDTIDIFD